MSIDSSASPYISDTVIKLMLAILIALSFVGDPSGAQAAPSVSCTMPGADHGAAVDHEKMKCCTPDCATPCPSAVVPSTRFGNEPMPGLAIAAAVSAIDGLPSISHETVDPPPRAFFV